MRFNLPKDMMSESLVHRLVTSIVEPSKEPSRETSYILVQAKKMNTSLLLIISWFWSKIWLLSRLIVLFNVLDIARNNELSITVTIRFSFNHLLIDS